jgi:hypothetical protein
MEAYPAVMTDAFANLLWRAHIDADDVEFVLTLPRAGHMWEVFETEALGTHIFG